jgi:MFS family permease
METEAREARVARPSIDATSRRRGLLVSIVEGVSAQSHSSLTGLGVNGNAITVGFALLLGAGDFELGLVAAIPPLCAILQLVAAAYGARLRSRKLGVIAASTVARVAWPLCGLLPFLITSRRLALVTFLAVWAISCALLSFSGNLWVSWMADLVPPRVRERYFALRSMACNVVGVVVGLAAGWSLDHWFGGVQRSASVGGTEDVLRAHGFALLFTLAALAGTACAFLLRAQPEPVRLATARPRPIGVRALLVEPFAEAWRAPGLRGLLVFVALFGFTNGCANPFWTPYQLENLKLDYWVVNGWLVITQGAGMMLTLPLWGRLAARAGNRWVVVLATLLICTHPLYYLIATPERTWPMYCDAGSSGIAWGGYNFAIFNLALALAAGPARDRLFAVYAAVAGLAQAASSVLAGGFVDRMPQVVDLAGLVLDRRQVVFLATSIARMGCVALFLAAVSEPRGVPIRTVIAAIPVFVKSRMELFKFMVRDPR